jgi:DNA-binding SARP family transcriptional activator
MQMDDARRTPQCQRSTAGTHKPQLTLLGAFELTCRGEKVDTAAPARRLLALTALSPAPLDRERAAVQLWPELSAERSRGNLRNALWRLRRACPALLADDQERLCLSPTVRVDVHDLTGLARDLDACTDLDAGLLGIDAKGLLAELLPGWQDDWLTVERERVRGVALHALEHLALLRSAAGRSIEAMDAAYHAVAADPLRESAVSALVRVHLAQGNRIDALRAYTSFRTRIRDELGIAVEPMPELQRHLAEGFRVGDHDEADGLPLDSIERLQGADGSQR